MSSYSKAQTSTIDSVKKDSVITYAKTLLGTKYKYASIDPKKGLDCSGFVYHVYHHFNVNVPRSSIDYINYGKEISIDSCKAGDVIVFTGTNAKNRHAGHVGIVISGTGKYVKFIHSSSNKKRGGVIISTFKDSPYYEKRFIKIVRVK